MLVTVNEADKTVTISMEEHNSLIEDQRLLNCLTAAGVDNWEGWDEAMEMFHEDD